MRLGVNVDHVATLRQARGENYPSVVEASKVSIENGADQITIHLREDRRHIQDQDVYQVHEVTKFNQVPLNLELGCASDIVELAIDVAPEWVCVVPEKREERTTEGGLNLTDEVQFQKIFETIQHIKECSPRTQVSLFVEANQATFEAVAKMQEMIRVVDAVEIHTGEYAKQYLERADITSYIEQFAKFKGPYEQLGIHYHAGHGLTDKSTQVLVDNDLFREFNIGHWIISQAVFEGLGPVVKRLKSIIEGK